jgi:hypothetical protein
VSPVAVAAPKLSPWAEKPPRPPGNRCAGDVGEVAADLKEDADGAVAAATTRERAIPVATDATVIDWPVLVRWSPAAIRS